MGNECFCCVLVSKYFSCLIILQQWDSKSQKCVWVSADGKKEEKRVSFYLISNENLTCHMGGKDVFCAMFCVTFLLNLIFILVSSSNHPCCVAVSDEMILLGRKISSSHNGFQSPQNIGRVF